jgi:hypothetical protein
MNDSPSAVPHAERGLRLADHVFVISLARRADRRHCRVNPGSTQIRDDDARAL